MSSQQQSTTASQDDNPWDLLSVYLDELSDVYTCLLSEGLVPNAKSSVNSTLSVVHLIQKLINKIRKVYCNICMLYQRCSELQRRLNRTTLKSRLERYYPVWNKLQVYEGVRCAYSRVLLKYSRQADTLVRQVTSRHQKFVTSYPDLFL